MFNYGCFSALTTKIIPSRRHCVGLWSGFLFVFCQIKNRRWQAGWDEKMVGWVGGDVVVLSQYIFTDNDINMEYYRIYGHEMVKLIDTIPLPILI